MSDVGAPTRTGWLDEPTCQSCHTGTATAQQRSDPLHVGVRRTGPRPRRPSTRPSPPTRTRPPRASRSTASRPVTAASQCEACHGSTHAEFPSSHRNDNIQSVAASGARRHARRVRRPATATQPRDRRRRAARHAPGRAELGAAAPGRRRARAARHALCTACHGADYRGTVLSRVAGRSHALGEFGTKHVWRGFQIGCYTCHAGPDGGDAQPESRARRAGRPHDDAGRTALRIGLGRQRRRPQRPHGAHRLAARSRNGRTRWRTRPRTSPDGRLQPGPTRFTFAAWDGSTDSNLGTVTVGVGGAPAAPTG